MGEYIAACRCIEINLLPNLTVQDKKRNLACPTHRKRLILTRVINNRSILISQAQTSLPSRADQNIILGCTSVKSDRITLMISGATVIKRRSSRSAGHSKMECLAIDPTVRIPVSPGKKRITRIANPGSYGLRPYSRRSQQGRACSQRKYRKPATSVKNRRRRRVAANAELPQPEVTAIDTEHPVRPPPHRHDSAAKRF
ncbi:hypothetical protein [Burkholderia cepacia]|uniref:hypothetical protein n=1 Tax=Burkholderia cepacia TaxID=292 RepID=UPI00298F4D12|nr:hypothetical protein [Burkholderia cepacia]